MIILEHDGRLIHTNYTKHFVDITCVYWKYTFISALDFTKVDEP